jgi:hypothetical protein
VRCSLILPRPKARQPCWCDSENRDKTETLLAFGASRFEACRSLAIDALRMALLPTINSMRYVCSSPINQLAYRYRFSIIGIISIPGMMTGAILGGADVQQAARLQMIIMFMISASTALSCMIATCFALSVCVDSEHRIRSDRIELRPHVLYRFSSGVVQTVVGTVRNAWTHLVGKGRDGMRIRGTDSNSERAPLLG